MSNMNKGLFGSRGQGDDSGRRTLISDEGYDRDPQNYCEKKRKDDPVDVIVKIEPSESRGEKREERGECCRCVDVVLNSSTGGAGPLAAVALTTPLPIVSVTIDADCVCDPSVLLTFTTLIVVPTAVLGSTLSFEVLRTTNIVGTPVNVGPVFTFTSPAAAPAITAPFMFQVFDNGLRSGTYTYSVLLTSATVIGIDGVTLLNSTLSALAVSSES